MKKQSIIISNVVFPIVVIIVTVIITGVVHFSQKSGTSDTLHTERIKTIKEKIKDHRESVKDNAQDIKELRGEYGQLSTAVGKLQMGQIHINKQLERIIHYQEGKV